MIFGMFFLLSLYMQQVLGFTALKTGIGYLAVALTAVVASGAAQALVTKTGVKPALLGGLTLVGGGLVLFTQISPTGSYMTDLFPGFIILGIGLGFTFVPISIAALAGVTGRDAGLASGLDQHVAADRGRARPCAPDHGRDFAHQQARAQWKSNARRSDLGLLAGVLGGCRRRRCCDRGDPRDRAEAGPRAGCGGSRGRSGRLRGGAPLLLEGIGRADIGSEVAARP